MAKKKVDLNAKPTDINKVKPEEVKTDGPTDTPTLPSTYTMFARKKERGFVAMTEQASMRSDESAAERRANSNNLPSRVTSCIHKIKED